MASYFAFRVTLGCVYWQLPPRDTSVNTNLYNTLLWHLRRLKDTYWTRIDGLRSEGFLVPYSHVHIIDYVLLRPCT